MPKVLKDETKQKKRRGRKVFILKILFIYILRLRRVAIITIWRTQLYSKEPTKETNIHGLNVATIITTTTTK